MQFLNRDTLVFLADDPTAADRIKILFWFQRCLFLLVSAGVTSSSWKEHTERDVAVAWIKLLFLAHHARGKLPLSAVQSSWAQGLLWLGLMYHGTSLWSLSCIVPETGFIVGSTAINLTKELQISSHFLQWAPVAWCYPSSVTNKNQDDDVCIWSIDGWISLSCLVPDKQPFCNMCCNATRTSRSCI